MSGMSDVDPHNGAQSDSESTPRTAADSIRLFEERGASSKRGKALVWARRASQVVFFLLFLYLLLQTAFRASFDGDASSTALASTSLDQPVGLFLETDPLVAVGTTLSSRSLYPKLLPALAIIVLTILLGRVFCGWICPFGTLNHWVSELRSGQKRRLRLERNEYKPWMRTKYYVLLGTLIAAVFGSAVFGWLDPICMMVRASYAVR